jgi:peroxiredoxin
MLPLLALAAALEEPPARAVALLETCDDPQRVLAQIAPSDRVQVHSALAGTGQTCYSVTLLASGTPVHGYVLGDGLAAIAAFERQRNAATSLDPAPPAPARTPSQEQTKAAPAAPRYFEDLDAPDVYDRPLHLANVKGNYILVHFWSTRGKASHADLSLVQNLLDTYGKRGLAVVGISLDHDRTKLAEFMEDAGFSWPVYLDRRGVARRYGVSQESLPATILLNRSREIIGSNLRGQELRKSVASLFGR